MITTFLSKLLGKGDDGAWRPVRGKRVEVPPPRDEYARSSRLAASADVGEGRREQVRFEWKDLWQSTLRIESRQALDLRAFQDGMLEFDLDVADLAHGAVKVKVGCGDGCGRSVNLLEPGRAWAGKGWQHVALAMRCFMRDGADFSKVALPFALEGTGSGSVAVANVRFTRQARAGLPCPDYRTESVTPAMLEGAGGNSILSAALNLATGKKGVTDVLGQLAGNFVNKGLSQLGLNNAAELAAQRMAQTLLQ